MKRLFLVALLFSIMNLDYTPAYASSIQYARIKLENTYFYSAPQENDAAKLFRLPVTYFVILNNNENENFYKAEYMDVSGYVRKEDVQPVKGSPIMPFANKNTFRVFAESGLHLRSMPATSPLNIIETVSFLDTNLIFYGDIKGEEAISYKGDVWYYCKYIKGANIYHGYLYSVFCDMLSPIENNLEVLEEISTPIFSNDDTNTSTNPSSIQGLSLPVQVIIIVGVSLTCIGIIYLLFKPTKIAVETQGSNGKVIKKKIKKIKKADYYEIDDI